MRGIASPVMLVSLVLHKSTNGRSGYRVATKHVSRRSADRRSRELAVMPGGKCVANGCRSYRRSRTRSC